MNGEPLRSLAGPPLRAAASLETHRELAAQHTIAVGIHARMGALVRRLEPHTPPETKKAARAELAVLARDLRAFALGRPIRPATPADPA